MTDHQRSRRAGADVAAVLVGAKCVRWPRDWATDCTNTVVKHPQCALAALTAAGIRCLYVPEGVEVEHGARLVSWGLWMGHRALYAIDATP